MQKSLMSKVISKFGKDKYTLSEDTTPIAAIDQQGKYHEFRTILRKHNIARRENAFEVLVNLFLCKIVDEEEHQTDLKFYWKGFAYDNYFDFVDRLQALYQRGMRKFLNEDISYISNEQIDSAFWAIKNDPSATKKQIQKYFRELKFFTNSAFSLIDTHNETLFIKNVKALLEIVQMWQKLRLKTKGQNQFLGDMFEYFLDNSIKQSNGQFFTPLPICKFIIASLPLETRIRHNKEPLKMIDYACGAGHFLNEYAYQIKPIVEQKQKDPAAYYEQITGLEKEDRLAKVSKIAAFMYGQAQIKILDTDALAQHPEVKPESYDILVANPPFAVQGFLQTLSRADKKQFQLIRVTGATSDTNTIQCFFLERLHHLMKANGVVGVIVPSSVLSNSDNVHTKTRDLLLQYFDIKSIVELGSATFGKTGTNTIILFLKRKHRRPEPAEQYHTRVFHFFEGTDQDEEIYQDYHFIESYCQAIQVEYEEYKKLFGLRDLADVKPLLEYPIFKDYQTAFYKSSEVKNLKKQRAFKAKSKADQQQILDTKLIDYLHQIEKQKLYYFILAKDQKGQVLIVNAPKDNKTQKTFLGYEWSGSKGNEGIRYKGATNVNEILTPLFNPKNFNDPTKINTAIKNNFSGKKLRHLPEYCRYACLTDMLDFSRVTFDKNINLNPKTNHEIERRWPLKRLGDIVETVESGKRPQGGVKDINKGVLSLGGEHIQPSNGYLELSNLKYVPVDFYESSKSGKLRENDLLICKDGALTGKVALLRKELENQKAMINEHVFILRCSSLDKQRYLFNFLLAPDGQNLLKQNITGAAQGGLNTANLKAIKLPLPPLYVRQEIAQQCEAIDREFEQANQKIRDCKSAIESAVEAVLNGGYEMLRLGNIVNFDFGERITKKDSEGLLYPVYGGGGESFRTDKYNRADEFIIARFAMSKNCVRYVSGKFWLLDSGGSFSIKQSYQPKILKKFIGNLLVFIQEEIYTLGRGMSQKNLDTKKIQQIKIALPPLEIQEKLVREVEQIEAKIQAAQAVIAGASEREAAILKEYL